MKEIESRSNCPISLTLDLMGDKWTLLIIRDMIFAGKKSYNEFLASQEGIATNILSIRLKTLEKEGIICKQVSPLKKSRKDFYLTQKGISLIPLIFELIIWGNAYCKVEEVEIFEAIKKDKVAVAHEYTKKLLLELEKTECAHHPN